MLRRHQTPQCLVWRIQIVLRSAKGHTNSKIARRTGKDRGTVRLWRARWVEAMPVLEAIREKKVSKRELAKLLETVLSDAYRCDAPGKFTAEQLTKVIAVACERPERSKRPVSHWTARELSDEVVKRHIVDSISVRTVGRLLGDADLKPHQSRYWLNAHPEDPAAFDAQVRTVCSLYLQARMMHAEGVHLMSTDEKTGIQALERKVPTLPMRPGLVERREFEYIRHGTR